MNRQQETSPLGIVAGGGVMPALVRDAAQRDGRSVFMIGIKGEAEPIAGLETFFRIDQIGHVVKSLRQNNCREVVIIGNVTRPNLLKMRPDAGGMKVLSRVLTARRNKTIGDDVLLSHIADYFAENDLQIIAPESVLADLAAPAGLLTRHAPDEIAEGDIQRGILVTRQIGELDIGQGSVVCRGQVLGVEGPEGTDAMLARVGGLPEVLRGTDAQRCGVLVKLPKPEQERRIDLPTLGITTIENAAAAGLAGIVFQSGGALIVDVNACISAANRHGLFLKGLDAEQ